MKRLDKKKSLWEPATIPPLEPHLLNLGEIQKSFDSRLRRSQNVCFSFGCSRPSDSMGGVSTGGNFDWV